MGIVYETEAQTFILFTSGGGNYFWEPWCYEEAESYTKGILSFTLREGHLSEV